MEQCEYCFLVVVGSKPEVDDIHLLLEYSKGQSWGAHFSERANRYQVLLLIIYAIDNTALLIPVISTQEESLVSDVN